MMDVVPRRPRKRNATVAQLEERAMKRIDRAVQRYGASAVAKYYSPAKSMFRGETKYFDCFFSATVDTAGDWGTANVPMTSYMNADGSTVSAYTDSALIPSAIGSGYGQVVGNKYILKKIKLRGELIPSASADQADAVGATTVRLLLVMDTQPNGAQANNNTLLTDWGSAAQINYSYQAISSGGGNRFRVLGDKIIQLQPAMMGTDGANTNSCIPRAAKFQFGKKWKKGLKVVIKSGASTPAVASLSDVNIYLVAHSSGNNAVTIRGNSRAIYVD